MPQIGTGSRKCTKKNTEYVTTSTNDVGSTQIKARLRPLVSFGDRGRLWNDIQVRAQRKVGFLITN